MLKKPLLPILRGVTPKQLDCLIQSFEAVGLDTMEITMNTKNVSELIKQASMNSNNMLIGAGTVTNEVELDTALVAGAQFIVTPVVNCAVIKKCVDNKIPVIPGALTPTEIFTAWDMGATMVKVFPANVFGPKYFKDVLGPLNKIKLMAVGGVNSSNISEYFNAGAAAAAFGGSLMSKDRLENNRYDLIEKDILNLLNKIT